MDHGQGGQFFRHGMYFCGIGIIRVLSCSKILQKFTYRNNIKNLYFGGMLIECDDFALSY